jgi:hypothetical protein
MQEELGSWVATIHIKALRNSNEADAELLQLLDTGEAMQEVAPKAVQFPN